MRWVGFSIFVIIAFLVAQNELPGERFEPEGLYLDHNYRDVFGSVNQCLGKDVLPLDRLGRSNRWFSGWSCDNVGDPDHIVTLNYKPQKGHVFYCRRDGKRVVGVAPVQEVEMNDIEFMDTWEDKLQRRYICAQMKTVAEGMRKGGNVLVHCDAGRDRTGAFAAMWSAMFLERAGVERKAIVEAIECDYRKSASLAPQKYGRMEKFLGKIWKRGETIEQFVQSQCELDPALIANALKFDVYRR